MKKSLLTLMFLAFLFQGISQNNFLFVSGTITDIGSGLPVPNYPVYIQTDSLNGGGFYYFGMEYTNANGYYADTIYFNGGFVPTGTLIVYTYDCQQFMHSATMNFSPGNQTFTQSFSICIAASNCDANFATQVLPNSLTVQFTDLSTGSPNADRMWSFGDGTTSNQLNPTHTYAQAGYYMVGLTISDSATNCWDSEYQYLLVGNDSTGSGCHAAFVAFPDSSNINKMNFFDQSTGTNIVSWFWDFGDGQYSYEQNPQHVYAQQGNYVACLTIMGFSSNTDTCTNTGCQGVWVGGNGGCQANFTFYPDSSANSLSSFQFVDLSVGGGATWLWSFGDSTYSSEQNPQHTYIQPGNYYVCLTITGLNPACQDTWCTIVTAGGGSDCVNTFTYAIVGNQATFVGELLTPGQATFYWSFGDGTTGTGETVTHTYNAQGWYPVTLTTATNTCTFSSLQTVYVGDTVVYNNTIYGQVYEGTSFLTSGIAMIFSVDSLNTLPYNAITLIDSMGYYVFTNVPYGNFVVWVIPTDASTYLPTYYGDVIYWQDATIINIGQPQNPYPIHLVEAGSLMAGQGGVNGHITNGLKNGLDDKMKMLLLDESENAIGYANVSSTGDFDFAGLAWGVYFLRAELPGITSDLIRIELTEAEPIAEVNLTMSGSHILGLKDVNPILVASTVYPNPFKDQVKIDITSKENLSARITVINRMGQQVIQTPFEISKGDNRINMELNALPSGIYLLNIEGATGLLMTTKLVKTN